MEFISIKNWHVYQHYSDRQMKWLKLYNAILDDYDYYKLTDSSKLLLISLFLLASITDNKIPNDPHWIRNTAHITADVDLEPLVEAGFLRLHDGKESVANCYQNAILDKNRGDKRRGAEIPPAVKAFRGATHRYPAKSWYQDIDDIVGQKPEDVGRWRELCKNWVGRGWNPVNVKGMLDQFQNGLRSDKKEFVEFD